MIRGIVFEGGGLNGAASSHHYSTTVSQGIVAPSIWAGDSIGAVLAYLTPLLGPEPTDAFWASVKQQNVYKGGGWLDQLLTLAGKRTGIYDMSPARATLSRIVAGRPLPQGVTIIVRTVDLKWGVVREHLLDANTPPESCCEMVYQSCLVPIAHGARGGRWADGGIAGGSPIKSVVKAGADQVDVLLLNPLGTAGPWTGSGALAEGYRAVDIMREELIAKDLEETYYRNLHPREGDKPRNIVIHEPIDPLPDWMDASETALDRRRAVRYQTLGLKSAVQVQRERRALALTESVKG